MPGGIIILVLALAGWLWWKGKLRGFTYDDAIAGLVFLLGLRLLTTGRLLAGAALMAGGILWAAHRRRQLGRHPSMSVSDARALLGVSDDATLADIREAHRRLIAKVHPDAGGSAELASRINEARVMLVAEMNRNTPRAS